VLHSFAFDKYDLHTTNDGADVDQIKSKCCV